VGQPCPTPGDGGLGALFALCPADSPRDFKNYVRRCYKAFPAAGFEDLKIFLLKRIAQEKRQGGVRNRHWDWEPLPPIPNTVVIPKVMEEEGLMGADIKTERVCDFTQLEFWSENLDNGSISESEESDFLGEIDGDCFDGSRVGDVRDEHLSPNLIRPMPADEPSSLAIGTLHSPQLSHGGSLEDVGYGFSVGLTPDKQKEESEIGEEKASRMPVQPLLCTPAASVVGAGSVKRRSPASRKKQMSRLLEFQEKLVSEKGLPKSRLQIRMARVKEVTPTSPPFLPHDTMPLCKENLIGDFTRLESPDQKPVHSPTSNSLKPAVAGVRGIQGCEKEGHVKESEMEKFQNDGAVLKVVSSNQNSSMLSHPRSESDHWHQSVPTTSFSTQDTSKGGGEQIIVNPQISEAWISGYRNGLGVAAQVFCWGCQNYGYIVPAIAATF